MFPTICLARNVFNVKFLLRINLKKFLKTQQSLYRGLNQVTIAKNHKSFYKLPSFYKYFNKYLIDNHHSGNVPNDIKMQYQQTLAEYEEIYEIINKSLPRDEFTSLAKTESTSLIDRLIDIQDKIFDYLCLDDRNVNECIFEVRAGIGGKEASLFVNELYILYLKFVTFNGWNILSYEKECEKVFIDKNSSLFKKTINVEGIGCYHLLRHEAGVHRVQRIPKTEKYGRIHTSTVSVSVLPVRHNLVIVKDSDLKFDVKNSSGAGGQNVNRNLTCVRVTHIPTGLTVESQETRFQHMNKELAIKKIKALLNELEYERLEKQVRQQKHLQIGISARSDKIRTYNFPQSRITDHRLSNDIYNIERYMNGHECEKMKNIMIKLENIRHQELKLKLRKLFDDNFEKIHNL